MPLTYIECCDQEFTLEEALDHVAKRQNKCEWTFELLAGMFASHTAHPSHEDKSRISTTTLTTKCLRSETLKRHEPYSEKPASLWASFRGTNMHAFFEGHTHPRAYAEARFHCENVLGLGPFSGSPDLVDPMAGYLYDYKRTKEVPRFDTVWPDHKQQLNINRWLVDHADYVELRDGSKLDLSDREVRSRFVPIEWQGLVIVYVDDKGPKPITCTKSIDVPAKKGGTKKQRVADIWSDDEVEALIAERYVAAREALSSGIADIPDGWEFQSHVLCGYCPVRQRCAELERQGV